MTAQVQLTMIQMIVMVQGRTLIAIFRLGNLVLKGCQNVYLLPSEYIAIGHNPVTWDEYVAYYDTITNTDTLVRFRMLKCFIPQLFLRTSAV